MINNPVFNRALECNLSPLPALLLAHRISPDRVNEVSNIISPDIRVLRKVISDANLDIAVSILKSHIDNNSHIVFTVDLDLDGMSCGAIAKMFSDIYQIPHTVLVNTRDRPRGVNDTTVDEILAIPDVSLVITADHGASDSNRYYRLKERGIDIIYTDHHHTDPSLQYVDAKVNPHYPDCNLPTELSGCAVLFILLSKVHKYYSRGDYLYTLLPIVGLSTIGDQMPLDSPINRYFIHYLLESIQSDTPPLWWSTYASHANIESFIYDDLPFGIIPIINASARLSQSHLGYEYLIETIPDISRDKLSKLVALNTQRQSLVKSLSSSMTIHQSPHSIISILPPIENASGVAGIIAGRLTDTHRIPSHVLVEHPTMYTGSCRSPSHIDLIDLFQYAREHSKSFIGGAGHSHAAGIRLSHDISDYQSTIDEYLSTLPTPTPVEPDYHLPIDRVSPQLLSLIESLLPYGNSFPVPLFSFTGTVYDIYINKNNTYGYIILKEDNHSIRCITFTPNILDNVLIEDTITLSGYITRAKDRSAIEIRISHITHSVISTVENIQ